MVHYRQVKCDTCKFSKDGICLVVEKAHPGKSNIGMGIQDPDHQCPLDPPRWRRMTEQKVARVPTVSSCNRCWRETTELDSSRICAQCRDDDAINRRNAARGINTFPRGPERKTAQEEIVRNIGVRRPIRSTGSFRPSGGSPEFISSEQYQRDIKTLVGLIPANTDAIVGIARSGLAAATMVSMYLHLPLLALRQMKGDIISAGNGWRLGGKRHIEIGRKAKVVVIDDTVMTGNSLRSIAGVLTGHFAHTTLAAVYVNPLAKRKPDIFVRELGWPHILEWNVFNSVLSPNVACDFDGILCCDCLPCQDDDGDRYLDFIRNARPLYLPKKSPIPLIVTARIERYRQETEAWLRRYGVRWNRLVMHPAKTLAERRRDDIAAFKAKHFQEWARRHRPKPAPLMFFESEDRQARAIAKATGQLVVCPHTARVY